MRRKKFIFWNENLNSHLNAYAVVDTVTDARNINLDLARHREGKPVTAFDSKTFLYQTPSVDYLIDIETGKVKKSRGYRYRQEFSRQFLVIDGSIYMTDGNRLHRLGEDLSDAESAEVTDTLYEMVESGGKIVMFVRRDLEVTSARESIHKYLLTTWDPETLKKVREIEVSDIEKKHLRMRSLGDEEVLLFGNNTMVSVNTKTGEKTPIEFEGVPGSLDVSPGGNIFVVKRPGEEKGKGKYKLIKEKYRLIEARSKLVIAESFHEGQVVALSDFHLLYVTAGEIQVWETPSKRGRIRRGAEFLCYLPVEESARTVLEMTSVVIEVPLTPQENRMENLRFKKELKGHKLPVPGDILGVIAGFV